jgi:hypothetical protein
MAKTINAYVPDQGEVEITLSAANITAVGAPFVTAESIVLDGVVRSFERTNNPERPHEATRVTGDTTPIVTVGNTVPEETWQLVIVDDYHSGAAGEWGTDDLAAVEIFQELFDHRSDPGGLKATPAGGATANIEITLVSPRILSVSVPVINADATRPAEVTVMFTAEGHTLAAHG